MQRNVHWCLSYHLFRPSPTHVPQLISSRVMGFVSSRARTIIAPSIFFNSSAFLPDGDAATRAARASAQRSRLSPVRAPIGVGWVCEPACEMMLLSCASISEALNSRPEASARGTTKKRFLRRTMMWLLVLGLNFSAVSEGLTG